jgi:hypothetical protein
MKISDIGKEIYSLVLENSHDFSPHYSKFENEFLKRYNESEELKNEVRVDLSNEGNYDAVKLSLLLSDFTSIFPFHKEKYLYTFDPREKGRKVIGPKSYLDKIKSEIPSGSVYPGYGSVSEELLESFFGKLYPLIEANKIFIRPEKVVFVADLSGTGGVRIHPASPNGRGDEWRVVNSPNSQSAYPLLDRGSSIKNYETLSDIIVPYINGVDIEEYAKILLEEDDLLSAFRVQTKSYIDYLKKNGSNIEEFKMDVMQPKLDLINRKFKLITNNHRLKVAGATLGTISLGLLSLTQSGMTAALSQFISFGLGTVGFVKSEAEYQEGIDKLKDNPEYLLWKMDKQQ